LFNKRETLWKDTPINGPPVPPVPIAFKSKRLSKQQVQANNKKQAKSICAQKNEKMIFNDLGEDSRTAFVTNQTGQLLLSGIEQTGRYSSIIEYWLSFADNPRIHENYSAPLF
jgi:CRISPR/Cas system-associated protein Cas7 (RAMP superfamily)